MTAIQYTRPYLYPKQQAAIFSGKRWSLVEASTKSGKTQGSIVRFIEWGLFGNGKFPVKPGQHYWWVAPTFSQAEIAFDRIKLNLTAGSFTSKANPPSITLPTGTILDFKSGDNPNSLYGEDVYAAVGDEASRWVPTAWPALRSTLTATGGPAVLIGNVQGKANFFYEFCRRVEAGLEPNGAYTRLTWKDAVEAGVLDIEEIEDARRNLSEREFRELYEAVASDDTGNPFGEDHIRACIQRNTLESPLILGKPVAFGIDLAKKQDYLVVIGFDDRGQVCLFDRWQGLPWRQSIRRIHALCGEDVPVLVDSTGVGDPVLEELQVEHGNFLGYNFTPASKQRLMEGLAVSIQGHEISYPAGPIVDELLRFEYELTRTGVRYSAPEGYNDDCVCALALARQAWVETQPAANIMDYWDEQAQRSREARLQVPGVLGSIDEPSDPDTVDRLANLIDNELTDLYEDTLRKYDAPKLKCFHCHKDVGPDRISDGVYVWHRDCLTGGLPRAA